MDRNFPRLHLFTLLALASCGGRGAVVTTTADSVPATPPWPPTFEQYATADTLIGAAAPIDYAADPDARRFRTTLEAARQAPANFAGHLQFVVWGCGTGCTSHLILDLRTGRTYDDTLVNFSCGTVGYRRSSRLVITGPDTAAERYQCLQRPRRYYLLNDSLLVELVRPGMLSLDQDEFEGWPARSSADSAFTLGLERARAHVDSLLLRPGIDRMLVARLENDSMVVVTDPEHWPEETETSFGFVRDSTGRVLVAWEAPASQSGDWTITYTHYFDAEGRTFAIERSSNEFGGCVLPDSTGGDEGEVAGVRATSVWYLAPTGRLMAKTFHRTDFYDKLDLTDLQECSTAHLYPYDKYATWPAMRAITGLERFAR